MKLYFEPLSVPPLQKSRHLLFILLPCLKLHHNFYHIVLCWYVFSSTRNNAKA